MLRVTLLLFDDGRMRCDSDSSDLVNPQARATLIVGMLDGAKQVYLPKATIIEPKP